MLHFDLDRSHRYDRLHAVQGGPCRAHFPDYPVHQAWDTDQCEEILDALIASVPLVKQWLATIVDVVNVEIRTLQHIEELILSVLLGILY